MISTEIVESITADGRIVTNKGVRRAAGNALVRVGSSVTVMGDMVLGWRRRTGYVPGAPVPAFGYKFASGTTMYYTDLDFNILSEEVITPPVEGAVLRLHCYNANVEYFVWFAGTSCIVQKDGETIAAFTAPAEVQDCDATIDGSDLVWVAKYSNWETDEHFIARYINGMDVFSLSLKDGLAPLVNELTVANAARFSSLVNGVKNTTLVRTDTYAEYYTSDYDRIYEAILWVESGGESYVNEGPVGYDLWAGRAFYDVRVQDSVFLRNQRKNTVNNNISSSSPDNPWVTTTNISGPYYYFADCTKRITSDNILLYSQVRAQGPTVNWYYGKDQSANQLFDGAQTLIDAREELPQYLFANTASKISFLAEPGRIDEEETGTLEPTTIFSAGVWAVQKRIASYGWDFWLMENGVDVIESYRLEGAAFAVDGDTLIVVNMWWIFKKKIGEDAEYFDAYIPGQATKRFTGVAI